MSLVVSLVALSVIALLFLDVEASVKYLEDKGGSGLFLEVFYFNRLWKKEYSYKDFDFRVEPFFSWLSLRKEVEGSEGEEIEAGHLEIGMAELCTSCREVYSVLTQLGKAAGLRRSFCNTILVRKLEWHTEVGLSDPMETGIRVGTGWAVKGWLVSHLTRLFPVRQVNLKVNPRFDRIVFRTEFACDVCFKVAHVLVVKWLFKRRAKQ